jgi:4-hydroxyphenylacetate 3-monooxygenase
MGARSGNNYLSALKKLGTRIWVGGERVNNPATYQTFAGRARLLASLYDLQMEKPEIMTFRTEDGGRAGMSLIQPRTADEVRKRGRMMKLWADYTCGLGDTPDLANVTLAAMDAAHLFFAESNRQYGSNIRNYYRQARDHDWCICSTLRAAAGNRLERESENAVQPLRLVERTREGVLVDGYSMVPAHAPLCEELLILPSSTRSSDFGSQDFAVAFAIPCNITGLRFIGSESLSRFNAPDCTAVFENVVVPWDRVFLSGDRERPDTFLSAVDAARHMLHQTAIRSLARGEFVLGLAALVAELSKAISNHNVRAHLGDMHETIERMHASVRQAEAEAASDSRGVFVPARAMLESSLGMFPQMTSRLREILRHIESTAASPEANAPDVAALWHLALEAAANLASGSEALDQPLPTDIWTRTSGALAEEGDYKPHLERVKVFLARHD